MTKRYRTDRSVEEGVDQARRLFHEIAYSAANARDAFDPQAESPAQGFILLQVIERLGLLADEGSGLLAGDRVLGGVDGWMLSKPWYGPEQEATQ
ncbi:MAG: hypothetical protein KJ011_05225 [Burkholderiaceae bacterium]|nr:hypothetical protein [Burkholderiaceae bacterium]